MTERKQRAHARHIDGWWTIRELVTRLGLPDGQTIRRDIKAKKLIPCRLPADEGRKNAPYYFRDKEVETYIKERQTPQPVQ